MVIVEFSARDAATLARWWAKALGRPVEATTVRPAGPGLVLRFTEPAAPKERKNGVHLDLRSESHHDQQKTVERLFNAGAGFADIGQTEAVPWVVMTDIEGNEFCVLEPRETYQDTGPLAAVVTDCADPQEQARWWSSRTGQPIADDTPEFAGVHLRTGPFLEFQRSATGPAGRVRLLIEPAR
ncbi:VOC family protein [Saccharopolyspora taberi]|uniref:Glyoxalase-like domain-containing protein n=1 Tax=Saccharopolyspora taberi TaxID=60895 RepID=A0ABN3V7F9_9PSEU